MRVVVSDVDEWYSRVVTHGGHKILGRCDIADRDYGMRDFTIEGRDGIAVRFATYITAVND